MSRGTNSWSPIGFVVYGAEPLAPARIEQHIVNALPSQELNIESFEEYEEALDFCKRNVNIGVIILHENCGKQEIDTVFTQLAKPYKASGWPVIGIIVRKSDALESIAALKAMRDCPAIVGYYSERDFEDLGKTLSIFDKLWASYINMVESELIPVVLQESLSALVTTKKAPEEKVFYYRISEMLAQSLNLSWIDYFRLRWHHLIFEANKINSAVLSPHIAVKKLILDNYNEQEISGLSILDITLLKEPLVIRAIGVCEKLINASNIEELEDLLKDVRREARPGRSGLLRHLASQSNAILAIYEDTYQNKLVRRVV